MKSREDVHAAARVVSLQHLHVVYPSRPQAIDHGAYCYREGYEQARRDMIADATIPRVPMGTSHD